jgi:ring-1,2-phenylacetyl-CoA epoxidase subunit PaaE
MTAATETAPSGERRRTPTFHPLRVAGIERLTDEAITITFAVPEPLRAEFAFTQGQHLTLRCELEGQEVRRNYSICSSATSGELRVAVKRLDGGIFSAWAHDDLRPGDTIDVLTPLGHFHTPLDPTCARHYVAVAAGSGITPVLSLLTTALEVEPRSSCTLVYGNRTTQTIMFLEELEDLKNRYPDRFELIHVLSREPQEVELFSGRVDPAKLTRLLDTLVPPEQVDEWYLCGPFEMVEATRTTLTERGVDPRRVHFELFHVDGEPVRPRRASAAGAGGARSLVTAVLDGRTTTFPVDRDGDRILDAMLAVRTDAPYACKGGVCGTCRAKLVEGEVEMERNYALEPDEVERGFVLACQSHPLTDRVSLDFDQ